MLGLVLQETIDGRLHVVHGANADLIRWARCSELAHAVFGPANVSNELLFKALGGDAYEVRVRHSKTIIVSLWHHHPALGPYPFLDTLSEFEFDRYFFKDYRDHVCHQLKVFLLGLFAYDNCPLLRDALDQKAVDASDPRGEFLKKWLVTAVYHDIGYILENDHALESNQKAWKRTRDRLNEVHAAPLSALPMFATELDAQVERVINNRTQIHRHTIEHITELEHYKGIDLFDSLREEAYLAGLGPRDESAKSPVRSYYEFAFAHAPYQVDRGRFRDHGVASALLLLNTWRAFEAYINRIIEKAGADPLIKPLFAKINDLAQRIPENSSLVRAAAAAMALHNIEGKIWDIGEAASSGLTLRNFRIHLTTPTKQAPLAFLLRLVDTLQDWDRPRFRPLKDGERPPLTDQDISITANSGKLWIHLPADKEFAEPATNPKSQYSKARAALLESLQEDAIDSLVGWTVDPFDMTKSSASTSVRKVVGMSMDVSVAASSAISTVSTIADKLYSSYQAHGKTKLFLLGTEYIKLAKRRIALVAKTPIPIVGPRPYEDGNEIHYEHDQYASYMEIIRESANGRGVEFRCIGSLPALRHGLVEIESPDFLKRISRNMNQLRDLSQMSNSKFRFGWMDQELSMTFVVADDHLLFWWKDRDGENVCLSTESALLAQSLYDSADAMLRAAVTAVDIVG